MLTAVDAAFAAGAAQRGGDAGLGEFGRMRRSGGYGQNRAGFGFGQVGGGLSGEGVQERRVILAQHRPQFVAGLTASPDRVLLGARQNRDGLNEFAVGGQRAVQVGVDPQDIGQHHRIGVVGLRAGHRVPFPVAGHSHRVDREHRAPSRAQRGHQQPPRGLDRDRDQILGAVAGGGEHLGQRAESGRVVTDALLGHQFSGTVDDRDVVMAFGPVNSA
jgi:hypothetical protein